MHQSFDITTATTADIKAELKRRQSASPDLSWASLRDIRAELERREINYFFVALEQRGCERNIVVGGNANNPDAARALNFALGEQGCAFGRIFDPVSELRRELGMDDEDDDE